ncbi:universal stress protein [Natronocalculus amylovorans]|uniref:Universal stress protein n=1 Tax=Natronocalculus amylovorans TaxID=2917812 RepID=A0AAE3FVQ8_9EURY|nr:universal stress protein [Natronocalculus amylovorans]MCL9816437.1 universal stress protein [Natronocalculus amylovorans]
MTATDGTPDRILVLVDDDHTVGPVTKQAAAIAASTGATLSLIAVIDPADGNRYFGPGTITAIDDAESQLIEEANALRSLHDVRIDAAVLRGEPEDVVPQYLESEAIDLFVLDRSVLTDRSRFGRWRLTDRLTELNERISVLLVGSGREQTTEQLD